MRSTAGSGSRSDTAAKWSSHHARIASAAWIVFLVNPGSLALTTVHVLHGNTFHPLGGGSAAATAACANACRAARRAASSLAFQAAASARQGAGGNAAASDLRSIFSMLARQRSSSLCCLSKWSVSSSNSTTT